MDEDGEFLHLIIGAAIGGIINWATHGFQFNAKGLGYFGVGALAGALSAGIGAGISSALVQGGSFSACFWGTAAAKTAATSFISGAAIGAGAGGSGGFVTGFGNGLIEGKNFGQALGQGALFGLGGAASGALIGGLWGGIDAYRNGREFWNGAKMIEQKTIVNQNLPLVRQQGDYNCGPATGESITGVPQQQYREIVGGNPNQDPVKAIDFNNAITKATGRKVAPFSRYLPSDKIGAEQLAGMMNRGNNFYLVSGTETLVDHATALNSITIKTFQKVSGAIYHKIVYEVMDPALGIYNNIGAHSMKFVFRIFP